MRLYIILTALMIIISCTQPNKPNMVEVCDLSRNYCDVYMACEALFRNKIQRQQNTIEINRMITTNDFVALTEKIEVGDSCALSLGFLLFEIALKGSDAGYLEDLSISISQSIESNAENYLKNIPLVLLEHKDTLISLSCGLPMNYIDDSEFTQKHLEHRLGALSQVNKMDLIPKRDIVANSIVMYLKKYSAERNK